MEFFAAGMAVIAVIIALDALAWHRRERLLRQLPWCACGNPDLLGWRHGADHCLGSCQCRGTLRERGIHRPDLCIPAREAR